MQNGAADEALHDAFVVAVEAEVEGVLLDDGHFVMGDIVMAAVAEMNPERLEWAGRDQFAKLFCPNPGQSIPEGARPFNCGDEN